MASIVLSFVGNGVANSAANISWYSIDAPVGSYANIYAYFNEGLVYSNQSANGSISGTWTYEPGFWGATNLVGTLYSNTNTILASNVVPIVLGNSYIAPDPQPSVSNKINAIDYNRLQNTINNILGFGNPNSTKTGYGQTPQTQNVPIGTKVTASQWNAVTRDINAMHKRQRGNVPTLSNVVYTNSNQVSYSNYTALAANLAFVATNYNMNNGLTTQVTGLSNSIAPGWFSAISGETTVTFSSANVAKYFFTQGGTINVRPTSVLPGSPTAKDTNWDTLISGISVYNYGLNEYNTGGNIVTKSQTFGTGTYSSNYFQSWANKTSDTSITFSCIFNDVYTGGGGYFDVDVGITAAYSVDYTKPSDYMTEFGGTFTQSIPSSITATIPLSISDNPSPVIFSASPNPFITRYINGDPTPTANTIMLSSSGGVIRVSNVSVGATPPNVTYTINWTGASGSANFAPFFCNSANNKSFTVAFYDMSNKSSYASNITLTLEGDSTTNTYFIPISGNTTDISTTFTSNISSNSLNLLKANNQQRVFTITNTSRAGSPRNANVQLLLPPGATVVSLNGTPTLKYKVIDISSGTVTVTANVNFTNVDLGVYYGNTSSGSGDSHNFYGTSGFGVRIIGDEIGTDLISDPIVTVGPVFSRTPTALSFQSYLNGNVPQYQNVTLSSTNGTSTVTSIVAGTPSASDGSATGLVRTYRYAANSATVSTPFNVSGNLVLNVLYYTITNPPVSNVSAINTITVTDIFRADNSAQGNLSLALTNQSTYAPQTFTTSQTSGGASGGTASYARGSNVVIASYILTSTALGDGTINFYVRPTGFLSNCNWTINAINNIGTSSIVSGTGNVSNPITTSLLMKKSGNISLLITANLSNINPESVSGNPALSITAIGNNGNNGTSVLSGNTYSWIANTVTVGGLLTVSPSQTISFSNFANDNSGNTQVMTLSATVEPVTILSANVITIGNANITHNWSNASGTTSFTPFTIPVNTSKSFDVVYFSKIPGSYSSNLTLTQSGAYSPVSPFVINYGLTVTQYVYTITVPSSSNAATSFSVTMSSTPIDINGTFSYSFVRRNDGATVISGTSSLLSNGTKTLSLSSQYPGLLDYSFTMNSSGEVITGNIAINSYESFTSNVTSSSQTPVTITPANGGSGSFTLYRGQRFRLTITGGVPNSVITYTGTTSGTINLGSDGTSTTIFDNYSTDGVSQSRVFTFPDPISHTKTVNYSFVSPSSVMKGYGSVNYANMTASLPNTKATAASYVKGFRSPIQYSFTGTGYIPQEQVTYSIYNTSNNALVGSGTLSGSVASDGTINWDNQTVLNATDPDSTRIDFMGTWSNYITSSVYMYTRRAPNLSSGPSLSASYITQNGTITLSWSYSSYGDRFKYATSKTGGTYTSATSQNLPTSSTGTFTYYGWVSDSLLEAYTQPSGSLSVYSGGVDAGSPSTISYSVINPAASPSTNNKFDITFTSLSFSVSGGIPNGMASYTVTGTNYKGTSLGTLNNETPIYLNSSGNGTATPSISAPGTYSVTIKFWSGVINSSTLLSTLTRNYYAAARPSTIFAVSTDLTLQKQRSMALTIQYDTSLWNAGIPSGTWSYSASASSFTYDATSSGHGLSGTVSTTSKTNGTILARFNADGPSTGSLFISMTQPAALDNFIYTSAGIYPSGSPSMGINLNNSPWGWTQFSNASGWAYGTQAYTIAGNIYNTCGSQGTFTGESGTVYRGYYAQIDYSTLVYWVNECLFGAQFLLQGDGTTLKPHFYDVFFNTAHPQFNPSGSAHTSTESSLWLYKDVSRGTSGTSRPSDPNIRYVSSSQYYGVFFDKP